MDLLGMAGRRPWLPMVVCCNTRDELDAVCAAVSNISYIYVTPLVFTIPLAVTILFIIPIATTTTKKLDMCHDLLAFNWHVMEIM